MDKKTLISEKATFLDGDLSGYAVRRSAGTAAEVYKVEGKRATLVGSTPTGDGIHRIVATHRSGVGIGAAAFFAGVDAQVGSVRPEVARVLSEAGYAPYNSGGGCMVWRSPLDDGSELSISCDDGRADTLDGDPAGARWIVGRYGGHEGYIDILSGMTLDAAIATGGRIPDPVDASGEPIEAGYETLEQAHDDAGVRASKARPLFERMGYAETVRAFSMGETEIALVGPGTFTEWSVVTHEGCDPDEPHAGSSGVEGYPSRVEAEAGFREAVAALRTNAPVP